MTNLGTLIVSKEVPVGDPPAKAASCNKGSCIGRVWVFYGDGTHSDQWGTMSRHGIQQYGKDIICRQLGYLKAHMSPILPEPLKNTSAPVWLKDMKCGKEPSIKKFAKSNIFECNHTICSKSDGCDHKDDLVISCCECTGPL